MKKNSRIFRTPSLLLFAFAATWLLSAVVGLLDGTPAQYYHEVVNERGPVAYIVLFLGFYVGGFAVATRIRGDYSDTLILGLFIYALLPAIVGFTGTVLGIGSSVSGGALYYLQSTSADVSAMEAVPEVLKGIGTACNPFLLGLLTVAINYPIIFSLCTKKAKTEPESGEVRETSSRPSD